MTPEHYPLLIEPDELERRLGEAGMRIVDLGKPETYAKGHIPGAVHVDYNRILSGGKPAPGKLPEPDQIAAVLAAAGIAPDTYVVAYDDEGGGRASRLLWTLDTIGHKYFSLLNGGIHSWANEGHLLTTDTVAPPATSYPIHETRQAVADKAYILAHLHDPHVALLDARSPEEFNGSKRLAARGGHIPGAANLNWLDTMDRNRNLRFKPEAELREMLAERNITPDKEVIVYCQTHHRSAHSYILLSHLGYHRVKGYPGSWSEWGNDAETPIE
jgi:thiosulfate/3-mercaptopyruvate sulfurtransferase